MYGLHRLLNNAHQRCREALQVDPVPDSGVECHQCLRYVVPAAVEAPVNQGLDAPKHGLEESRDHQRRDSDGHCTTLVSDSTESILKQDDAAEICGCQHGRQHAVNKRPIDKKVNVPQPVAQDRYYHYNRGASGTVRAGGRGVTSLLSCREAAIWLRSFHFAKDGPFRQMIGNLQHPPAPLEFIPCLSSNEVRDGLLITGKVGQLRQSGLDAG